MNRRLESGREQVAESAAHEVEAAPDKNGKMQHTCVRCGYAGREMPPIPCLDGTPVDSLRTTHLARVITPTIERTGLRARGAKRTPPEQSSGGTS